MSQHFERISHHIKEKQQRSRSRSRTPVKEEQPKEETKNKDGHSQQKLQQQQPFVPQIISEDQHLYDSIPDQVKTSLSLFPQEPSTILLDTDVHLRTKEILSAEGFTPENTLFGSSICPDQINNETGDLANRMYTYWGEEFPMGGLAGVPFVGQTGYSAFSHHIPEDGNILVLFGPHISISPDGKIGEYKRIGQEKQSTACGAAIGAYNIVKNDKQHPDCPYDTQFTWIINSLKEHLVDINQADQPLIQLSLVMYEIIQNYILNIVHTNFGRGKLALLGGIQINTPDDSDDCFLPLYFQIHQKNTENKDFLSDLNQITDQLIFQTKN